MGELASYFSGGGVIIALLWFGFKSYMDKRKDESEQLKKVNVEGKVEDAIHRTEIKSLDKRLTHLEDKVYGR